MSEKQSSFECTLICWGIAAVVGLVSMVMLYMLAGFDGNQAFFTGALIGLLLGLLLTVFVCRGQRSAADLAAEEKPAQRYKREAAEEAASRGSASAAATPSAAMAHAEASAGGAAGAGHTEAPAASASAAEAGHAEAPAAAAAPATASSATASAAVGSSVKPSAALAGEAEVAARKGEWRYESGNDPSPAAGSAPAAAPAAAKAAEPAAAPAAEVSSADVEEQKPATLYTSPPAEGADDLKRISGVGPKLEQTLNELGIYRFAQVADWGPADIAWVDNRLRFKGRIERDDWMSQAKILAAGGETEFSARKKK